MAGKGPSPSMNRRHRGQPLRGDWQKLKPLGVRVLPELDEFEPPGDEWPARTRLLWEAWAVSPVTAVWTPDDVALAVDTIHLHAGYADAKAPEIRVRIESLGLGAKGRADRRLLLPDEEAPEAPAAPPRVERLRAI